MEIQLSDHFTYKKLIKFVLPSIIMMIFTSIYGVVDGFFISNFVGKTPFAAVNLIIPFTMVLGALGFMFGTGGSALVSLKLGQGKTEEANRIFSLIVYVGIGSGIVLAILGIVFTEPIAILLGADETLLPYCVLYGRIILVALPAFMLQNMFQSFLITAERPDLGLKITVFAGITNMVLDALFMAVLPWGTAGAALATGISQCIGGLVPIVYFIKNKKGLLHLGKAGFDRKALWQTCANGSSELVTNISMSLVSMLYNIQLIHYAGENGVAAYGVIMYVSFIFIAIFLGYSIGTAPIIGYHYGAANTDELKNIFKKSMLLVAGAGITLTTVAILFSPLLSQIFVGYDPELFAMTNRGFKLYAISFLFTGFSIYGSSLFTALNDGLISAIISFLRTLVFQVLAIMILPIFLKLDGIWYAIIVAEVTAMIIAMGLIWKYRKKYQYM